MQENKKKFIKNLINYRDYCLEQNSESLTGDKHIDLINNLVSSYFAERSSRVPFQKLSYFVNFSDCAKILNDKILLYIYEENQEDMSIDWRQLITLNKDLNPNDEDLF
jgi:hypothetical protein